MLIGNLSFYLRLLNVSEENTYFGSILIRFLNVFVPVVGRAKCFRKPSILERFCTKPLIDEYEVAYLAVWLYQDQVNYFHCCHYHLNTLYKFMKDKNNDKKGNEEIYLKEIDFQEELYSQSSELRANFGHKLLGPSPRTSHSVKLSRD